MSALLGRHGRDEYGCSFVHRPDVLFFFFKVMFWFLYLGNVWSSLDSTSIEHGL